MPKSVSRMKKVLAGTMIINCDISLVLDTEVDFDLIEFLDRYKEDDRETIIKSIIRFYISKESQTDGVEIRLDNIENTLRKLANLVKETRHAVINSESVNHDIIDIDIDNRLSEEAEGNLMNIFKE